MPWMATVETPTAAEGASSMQVATALALLERHAPRFAPRLKKWFVEHAEPMNQAIGLRIDEVADDSSRVVLRLPPGGAT
jgi:hypothetical protein